MSGAKRGRRMNGQSSVIAGIMRVAAMVDVMVTMDGKTSSVMNMTANDERIVVTLGVRTTRTTETIETDMTVAKGDRDGERYEHHRPRSPPRDRTPPSPVPISTEPRTLPPVPSSTPTAKPALKDMTREEREAFIRAEAQKRLQVQMYKLGLVSSSSGSGSPTPLGRAVEDRLAKEKAEISRRHWSLHQAPGNRTAGQIGAGLLQGK